MVRSIWYRRAHQNYDWVPKKLDPSVRNYWFISLVSSVCLLLLIFTPVLYIGTLVYGERVFLGVFTIIGASICGAAIWSYAAYPYFSYTIGRDGIEIRHRVLAKKRSFVPYDRISEMKVTQNPFERLFGLKTIYIRTVGWDARVEDCLIQGITNPYAIINRVELASDLYRFPVYEEPYYDWSLPSTFSSEREWGTATRWASPSY